MHVRGCLKAWGSTRRVLSCRRSGWAFRASQFIRARKGVGCVWTPWQWGILSESYRSGACYPHPFQLPRLSWTSDWATPQPLGNRRGNAVHPWVVCPPPRVTPILSKAKRRPAGASRDRHTRFKAAIPTQGARGSICPSVSSLSVPCLHTRLPQSRILHSATGPLWQRPP